MPVVAPMVGGAIAAFVYWFFIEAHHTMEIEDKQSTSEDGTQEDPEIVVVNNATHIIETAA